MKNRPTSKSPTSWTSPKGGNIYLHRQFHLQRSSYLHPNDWWKYEKWRIDKKEEEEETGAELKSLKEFERCPEIYGVTWTKRSSKSTRFDTGFGISRTHLGIWGWKHVKNLEGGGKNLKEKVLLDRWVGTFIRKWWCGGILELKGGRLGVFYIGNNLLMDIYHYLEAATRIFFFFFFNYYNINLVVTCGWDCRCKS